LVSENVFMVIDLPKSVFKQYHSDKDFSAVYLQYGGENGEHRYETKLRHCHAMYMSTEVKQESK